MKAKELIFILSFFCFSLIGCKNNDINNKELEPENTDTFITVSPELDEDKITDDIVSVTTNKESNDKNDDKLDDVDISNYDMKYIKLLEDAGYSLAQDEYIADTEWVPSEQYQCLRIMIDYIEQPEDAYQHKADYFIFYDDSKENIMDMLYINYTDKRLGSGNDFESYMTDITFDGSEDLIISLGDSGASSMYCAYIHSDTGFRYEPTYSDIPSPKINYENKTIKGWCSDSLISYTDFIYIYSNGQFVCNKMLHYEWDTETVGEYKLVDTKEFTATDIYDKYVASSQINENLCGDNEEVVYSFRTLEEQKVVSLCKNDKEDYIIFRYGTEENIEIEYPDILDDSWNNFAYCYYLRGGGPDNEGLDLNFITFKSKEYSYILYEKYYATDDEHQYGMIIINNDNGNEKDMIGSSDSVIGTLINFRRDNKILEGSLVDSLVLE